MTASLAPDDLARLWTTLRTVKPAIRARDAADELGVSEAEIVATMVGDTAVRLDGNACDLLHALSHVGRCKALTRNQHAMVEVRGRYGAGLDLGAPAGRVVGEHLDLRVVLDHWRTIFAVNEPHPQRRGQRRRSIQVYDRSGAAVHKVVLEPDGDAATWDAVVETRRVTEPLVIERPGRKRRPRPDSAIDRNGLIADWDAMTDTRELFDVLAKHGAKRTQALRLAGESRARAVRDDAIDHVLHDAANTGDKIRIFLGNRGCVQVFAGAVSRITRHGPWLDVTDPDLHLRMRTDQIASSWVVTKPTRAGKISSLELFDRAGETIALVYCKRDGHMRSEAPRWHAVLERCCGVRR